MKNILIVGASGFIGSNVLEFLYKKNEFNLTTLSRKKLLNNNFKKTNIIYIDDFFSYQEWDKIMKKIDVLIIAIGAAHNKYDSLIYMDKVNYFLPKLLTKHAIANEIKKIIFISSCSVYKENTNYTEPINESMVTYPETGYGISKLKAENELIKICKNQTELIIVRPPLVYGNNAFDNFRKVQNLVSLGFYLPTKLFNAKRSFIYIKNLSYFIYLCITYTKTNGLYLISDDDDISFSKMVSTINKAMNQKDRQFKLNLKIISFLTKIIFMNKKFRKVSKYFIIDISKAKEKMGYVPIYNFDTAIKDIYTNNKLL